MLLKHSIFVPVCGSTLILVSVFGQDHPVSEAGTNTEAAVPSVENTNTDRTQPSSTVNYGFLGGCHFSFNERRGAELSYGCNRNTQAYSLGGDSLGVKNNSDEGSATYASQLPARSRSILAPPGASAPIFDPTNVTGAGTQSRLWYLYGCGADFNPKRQVPRTEHRGVFYNSATFNMDGLNGLDQFAKRSEPSVVFGYSF